MIMVQFGPTAVGDDSLVVSCLILLLLVCVESHCLG